jgi:transposase
VTTERPTREQLIELAKSDPEAIADLVLMLWDRVDALEARLAQLERNSANSSKPPSSDRDSFNPPPKPKSLRKKSGRKPGGQAGHQGDTLRQIDDPERVVEHRLRAEAQCPRCGATIEKSDDEGPLLKGQCECRQVFELPAIRIEVTEHRAERRRCGRCGTQVSAAFPEGVNSPAQYGEGIQAAALYLGAHQLIPYQRLSEVFTDLFGCPLSSGTLANFVKRGGAKAGESMKPVRNALRLAKLAHADETGCRLHGKRHWLHVFSTAKLTSYHIDSKRGSEGMDRLGLLGGFAGSLVHDFLSSYYRFGCEHFLCAAHLLRELVYLHEEMDQPWAADMIALLREAKKLRDRDRNRPQGARRVIGEKTRLRIALRYCEIVLEGLALNPEPPPPPKGKRGRIKRGKALNLLIRLEERYEQIMGFFEHDQGKRRKNGPRLRGVGDDGGAQHRSKL